MAFSRRTEKPRPMRMLVEMGSWKRFMIDLYGVILLAVVMEFFFGYNFFYKYVRISVIGILLVWISFGLSRGIWSFFMSSYGNFPPGRYPTPKRDKKTSTGSNDLFDYAAVEVQGWRPAMEDASLIELFFTDRRLYSWSLFAVFDGHGGPQVSRWLATNVIPALKETVDGQWSSQETPLSLPQMESAMRKTCQNLDVKLRNCGHYDFVGSTCNWVMMNKDNMICANIGDSRCIYSSDGKAVDVSIDHKPERKSERERIENAGGVVYQTGPCYRVDGCGLNLSRAFGDFHYKQRLDLAAEDQKVSAVPDTFIVDFQREKIEFVLIACDGVFELPSQEVADAVRSTLQSNGHLVAVSSLADKCISPSLIQTQGKGGDNVSAILITIKDNAGNIRLNSR